MVRKLPPHCLPFYLVLRQQRFRTLSRRLRWLAQRQHESTADSGADAAPLGKTTTPYDQTIIRNGSNIEDPEPKAPLSTRERAQWVPYANRIEKVTFHSSQLRINGLMPMGR